MTATPADPVLEQLLALPELPVHEHVQVYDTVHRLLQDALASLDEA